MKDLRGEKFGDLEVIDKIGSRKRRGKSEIYWRCKCSCGREIEATTDMLSQGKTNCGCKNNKTKNLIGKKFGRLTVVDYIGKNKNMKRIWLCKCECGKEKEVPTSYLTSGDTKSCGCLLSDRSREFYSKLNKTHGMTHTRLYVKWRGMIDRCYNKRTNGYENYGGRGIKVCNEWRNDFKKFYEWANKTGYKNGLTIDRIDVNKDYCPNNCRWATIKEQANNKRNNCYLTYNGKKRTLKQWSEKLNVKYATLKCRKDKGWKNEEILFGRNKY